MLILEHAEHQSAKWDLLWNDKMIDETKYSHALYALHLIFVRGRYMSLTNESPQDIAALLDYAERLPSFIASNDNRTEEFRAYLVEIATRFPACKYILTRFDEPSIPEKW